MTWGHSAADSPIILQRLGFCERYVQARARPKAWELHWICSSRSWTPISRESLGEGSQGNPIRPIRNYKGLLVLGFIGKTLVYTLMACMMDVITYILDYRPLSAHVHL